MVQLKCPSCNANIELDGAREFGFCCYCGTKVIFKDNNKKIDGIAGVESLLKRAKQFMDNYQVSRAEEYYNKVLDIDPSNQIAQEGLNKIIRYKSPSSVLNDKPSEVIDCNCPTCNKELLLDKKIGFVICPLCGTNVTEKLLNERSDFAKQLRQPPKFVVQDDSWLRRYASEAIIAIQNCCLENRSKGYMSGYFVNGDGTDYGITPHISKDFGSIFFNGEKEKVCKCIAEEIRKLGFEKFSVRPEYAQEIRRKQDGFTFWGKAKYVNETRDGYKIFIEIHW